MHVIASSIARVAFASFREPLHRAPFLCIPFLVLLFLSTEMSQSSSKQLMSGLKSVKRDFSSNTLPSSSQSSEDSKSRQLGPNGSRNSLTAQERRLKLIQDALKDHSASGDKLSCSGGLVSAGHKRANTAQEEPAAKRRQLPSSWSMASALQTTQTKNPLVVNGKMASSSASANSSSRATITVSSSSASSSKPAPVFLSQEQTHILKLVEGGESIFYTGSAGE